MRLEPFVNIFKDSTSNFIKVKKEDYKIMGRFPIVDQGQKFIGGFTDDENLVVKDNLPVIIFGDHTKVFKYVDFPFTIGADGVKVLTLKNNKFNALFYYYFLKSLKIVDKGYSRHFKYLKEKKLPIPDKISDQFHIATLLSKAENLISQRKESIRLLDEFLKSTFLEMFGDPSTNRKNFPKGTLRDVVTEVKYGTSSPAEDEGLFPYLRMNNITTDGYMDYSKLKFINIIDEREKEKYVVRKGDLLFNRTNSKELVGKTGVFNEDSEMIIAGYLIRIRTNDKINPWFLWGYLNSIHGKQKLFGMCKSIVGMANINAQELQGIRILIPPIDLQTKFAQIVEKTEALKTQYRQSLMELENLYGSLSQKAFKGELHAGVGGC
jgi:type I restriction enzyme, S subunit